MNSQQKEPRMNFRSTSRFLTALAGLAALAVSTSVQAHPGHGEVASFVAGFSHPLLGLDHVLAMLAVGVWAAQARSAGRVMWVAPLAAPLTFVAAMLLGAMLGLSGLSVPLVEPMIAASVLVFGLLVAARAQKGAVVMSLIGAFALFHGIAHGAEFGAAADASVAGWMLGFTLATALLHAAGIAIALGLDSGLRGDALKSRMTGVPVVLAGAVLMFQTLPA
jgi:urease accessory protein